jgi:hypothetical protein
VATSGPIVHPQAINEHGELWWNDIDRGRLLICSPELSGNPNSHLVAKQDELVKEIMNFVL